MNGRMHIQNEHRAERLSRALGWFSIGLGVAELVAPGGVAKVAGVRGNEGLVRTYGAREIATGLGLLAGGGQARWLWARVAGDVLDLASLGNAARSSGTRRRIAFAAAAVAGVALLDFVAARSLS